MQKTEVICMHSIVNPFISSLPPTPPHFPFNFPSFAFVGASLTRSWVLLWQANIQGYSPTSVIGCVVQKTKVVCVYSIILSFIFPICFSLHFPFICIFEDASLTRSWVLLWQANSQGYSNTCIWLCSAKNRSHLL